MRHAVPPLRRRHAEAALAKEARVPVVHPHGARGAQAAVAVVPPQEGLLRRAPGAHVERGGAPHDGLRPVDGGEAVARERRAPRVKGVRGSVAGRRRRGGRGGRPAGGVVQRPGEGVGREDANAEVGEGCGRECHDEDDPCDRVGPRRLLGINIFRPW